MKSYIFIASFQLEFMSDFAPKAFTNTSRKARNGRMIRVPYEDTCMYSEERLLAGVLQAL